MLGGLSFKSSLFNHEGVWVKIRELNYLAEKSIIQVDEEALRNHVDREDAEFKRYMQGSTLEERLQDMLGRDLDDTDRKFLEAARRDSNGGA